MLEIASAVFDKVLKNKALEYISADELNQIEQEKKAKATAATDTSKEKPKPPPKNFSWFVGRVIKQLGGAVGTFVSFIIMFLGGWIMVEIGQPDEMLWTIAYFLIGMSLAPFLILYRLFKIFMEKRKNGKLATKLNVSPNILERVQKLN